MLGSGWCWTNWAHTRRRVFPAASYGGYAETAAAYRLFDNERVTFDKVLAPHIDVTRQRIAGQRVVLLPQDTTEIDLTRPEQRVVAAPARSMWIRRGGDFLHLLHAFTPNGAPLGTLHAHTWVREDEPSLSMAERETRKKHTPIEEKESYRWVSTLQRAQAEARRNPQTQFVCLADSEADIYELLMAGTAEASRWIGSCALSGSRIAGRRRGNNAAFAGAGPGLSCPLHEHDYGSQPNAKVACEQRGRRQSRVGRKAAVEVRARSTVTLRPPWRVDGKLPAVTVNVVLVREIDPPVGEEPVEWILLTSLPIETCEQVRGVAEYYCARWMVEILFRAEIGLPGGGASIRTYRSAVAVPGRVLDRLVADFARVPPRARMPGS